MMENEIPWNKAPEGYDYYIIDHVSGAEKFHRLEDEWHGNEYRASYVDEEGFWWPTNSCQITLFKRPTTGIVKQKEKSSLELQIGGEHYKNKGIQPIEYAFANDLGFAEANIVKYVSRHQDKNGAEDIRKAIHYCKFILEFKYGIKE